ncbi:MULTISPECIES: P-type conjugative transfer protein TrbL [unclassified Mesorhizobium]|uniref:P-type conjugative transfer protein TrbL n=1 Tax=unclassified Mesorhizobium TaxID=325217 RepID=UPI0011261553|nr:MULTISPECIES: P-type conjugative transfer protein TrbL [unclassified Mesorhizobium]MBZ9982581.1 P-type conjugative transfer protein TrbL [Mesorhizobium sp. BR-1-1-8]TPL26883.1 P-type conjugative transfer protein TrbL [Mesorhizobium sp. B2-4-8]TPL59255.1 P-type conjugative transfer protein TrbL [Mesorhizobium sp. B2-4-1]
MVTKQKRRFGIVAVFAAALVLLACAPGFAQEGSVLTTLENSVVTAAKGWETTVTDAARSLFWILAGIEISVAAVWLAINAISLDAWFAELVRRIMFVGLFAFILEQGPSFAKAIVDSLFQIGANGGSASPANVFDAGIRVASKMAEQARFGLFEDNALAIAAVFAMIVVVVSFSLVAAIFVAVMVEMYVGLLAGMIMLGLGGSSFTKDFAVRYLVYAFSVGMKLMALVMIARIGSEVLLGLAEASTATSDQFITTLAIAGISVVVFIIAMYVPAILQGVVQGASIAGGMEAIRHGAQAGTFAAGGAFLGASAAAKGADAARDAKASGSSLAGAALRGMASGIGNAGWAAGSAAKEKAIASPGAYAGSVLGLANAKLEEKRQSGRVPVRQQPPPLEDK